MPSLTIPNQHNHLFALELLQTRFSPLYEEVLEVLQTTPIPPPSKPSKEKGKLGKVVYRGGDFNGPLKEAFAKKGWMRNRVPFPGQTRYWTEMDLVKDRVGVELQFGKYSFVQYDFTRFLTFFEQDELDVGIEIIPSESLHKLFYSGPANFQAVDVSLSNHRRNDPAMPLLILGIDVVQT